MEASNCNRYVEPLERGKIGEKHVLSVTNKITRIPFGVQNGAGAIGGASSGKVSTSSGD